MLLQVPPLRPTRFKEQLSQALKVRRVLIKTHR
jgi:hypothetical protein